MMTETVVNVTTLEQWKSVLDVWFKQGYKWFLGEKTYDENKYLSGRSRHLGLNIHGANEISYWPGDNCYSSNIIEYSDFMAQQKEDKEVKTYYVTQEQLDLIERAKRLSYPLTAISSPESLQKEFNNTNFSNENEILRYIGGDETIEFKVKEQLHRLWRVDEEEDTVYMTFVHGTPDWTATPGLAFTAPLEEIKKHKTVSWEIEKVE